MPYNNFAKVYDLLMEDVSYDEWVSYIQSIFLKNNLSPKTILDLACGTGNMTSKLYKQGYDVIGVDISSDMLSVAKEKALDEKENILYLNQDMREFELYGTIDCVVCLFDSLNYILEEVEILEVFKLVNNYLNPNGLFVFDINTEYKFKEVLSDNTYSDTNDSMVCVWENFFDEDQKINEYYANFFIKNENDKFYERFEEYHYERAYNVSTIMNLIEKSGLEILDIYDAFTFKKPNEKSERIYFVTREIKKTK